MHSAVTPRVASTSHPAHHAAFARVSCPCARRPPHGLLCQQETRPQPALHTAPNPWLELGRYGLTT
eukprot:12751056-Alexandrium_andersonii.AAC.1